MNRYTQLPFLLLSHCLKAALLFLAVLLSPITSQVVVAQEAGVQADKDVRLLESGKPVERELAGGQTHSYQITLSAGQYLSVVVEQRGIDVVVELFGSDGKQIAGFDSESGNQGRETVSQVAEASGSHRLVVKPKQKVAPAGRYEIRIGELRAATELDRALQEARNLFAESVRLYRAGKYNEAQPLAEHALGVREKALGPEHLETAQSLNFLAVVYLDKGDYARAEPHFQRALIIREKRLGAEHPETAQSLNNLANLYRAKGDYAKAEPLYQRALTIWEKTLGPEHPFVAASLNNLALLYRNRGDYEKAEPLLQRALTIQEKALGPEHLSVVFPLGNLARLFYGRGDYAKAEPLYQRALTIEEKELGPEHPSVAASLHDLATLHGATGDYAKAEPLYGRALTVWEKALGPEHPNVAASLNNLAKLYEVKGETAQAIAFKSRATAVSERNIALNVTTGSERQKLAYLATFAKESSHVVSLHVHSAPTDKAARSLALTTILQRKGRALDAMADSIAALRRRASPQDQVLLDQYKNAKAELARLVLGGPQKTTPAEHQSRIWNVREQVEKLEAEIGGHSAEFAAQSQPVTLASVQSVVPAQAALIEFFTYRPVKAKYIKPDEAYDSPRYVAYVLQQQGEPQWVDLGEAKAIDDSVTALRRALRDQKRADVKRLARKVDEQVMRPVRALLGETRQVLISPDGALNLVPFAALVDERNRYLVTRYSFSYLTSGRDLLRLQLRQPSKQAPVVVADPAFGERASAEALASRDLGLPDGSQQPVAQSLGLAQMYFRPLPGAASEARALRTVLPQATMLTGQQATETAIKQVGSPNILHVATHGFFLQDVETKTAGARDFGLPGGGQLSITPGQFENPLLRSGLALAGANQRKSGPNQEEDGVLTALEAAGLDLWGTKLVVLSACDTGVGEVKNGDGVYGLRRALVLAGSESQVMSLWAVSDWGTRDLMVDYYRALQQGQGRGEALRQVQLRMLRSKNRQHPYYWAGFIQSGEWGNLDGKR